MQKVLIGILALVALYFAATNARLGVRLRVLEDQVKASEARLRPRTAVPTSAEIAAPPALPEKPEAAPIGAAAAVASPIRKDRGPAPSTKAEEPVRRDLPWVMENSTSSHLEVVLADTGENLTERAQRAVRQLVNVELVELHQTLDLPQVDRVFPGPAESPSAGPRAGYLGVSASNASGGGAQISQVMPDSAASSFGLQAGDVILDFNGEPVSDFAGLSAKIRATFEGTPVVLRINRGGSEMVQSVVMGGRR